MLLRWIDLAHRWAGGVIGLLLALLGLSGSILTFKHQWIMLPGARDAAQQDVPALARQVEAAMAHAEPTRSILFPYADFGLARLTREGDAGAYADQSGRIVSEWSSVWDRPELWLFDFHHYLLLGDAGKTIAGIAGIAGLLFVVTGAILWWRTRKTFRLRIWPKRMSRTGIVTHHRDLGIAFTPLLFVTLLTGSMMVFQPLAGALLAPGKPANSLSAPFKAPQVEGGPLAARPDWPGMLQAARHRFPDAEVRLVSLPREPGGLIQMRLRQPAEWLPNGRTLVWFDPADGRMIDSRDEAAMPAATRTNNKVYPIHSGKVGGIVWKLLVCASGLALAMLGSFAVWTFWFRRARPNARPPRPAIA